MSAALSFDEPFCECDDIHCSEHLPIGWNRYKRLCHQGKVVLPTHAKPGQQEVSHGKGWVVVIDRPKASKKRVA